MTSANSKRVLDAPVPDPARLLGTLEHILQIDAADQRTALNRVADVLGEAFGAEKVDVWLKEPHTETIAVVGISDTPLSRRERDLGLDRLALANGGRLVGVFVNNQTFRTGRADADPVVLPGFREGLGIRSMLAVPLRVGSDVRGVLLLSSTTPDRFSAADEAFLEAAVRWVGALLQRLELTERLAQQAREEGRRLAADELVAVLAHDLRNLLVPASGRLQLLRKRLAQGDHGRCVEDVELALVGLARQERLTGDLLDATRLEAGLFALELGAVDLVDLATEVARGAGVDAAGAALVQVCADRREVCVRADPDRLRQALENLVSNAAKYAPSGTSVVVEVRQEDGPEGARGVLAVVDHGPGIAPEVQGRLFTRFGKGPRSAGLGLGLYLAHGIAAAHGGSLSVASAPGAGARFTLTIPLDD